MFSDYKGIIKMEDFLLSEYSYKYTTIEDLKKQNFIEFESIGTFALFWIKYKDSKYLFKLSPNNLGELITMEIANILGIPCAEYRLATIGDKKGILSKKFTKDNQNIILGAQIIQEVLNNYPKMFPNNVSNVLNDPNFIEIYNIPANILTLDHLNKIKYVHNNLNNLEELTSIIYLFFKGRGIDGAGDLTKVIINYLVSVFMIDIITMQSDRHVQNWGIKNDDMGRFGLIPLFDNIASYNLFYDDLDKKIELFNHQFDICSDNPSNKNLSILKGMMYKKKPLLSVSEDDIINARIRKRRNGLEMLDTFLRYSDYRYVEKFSSYVNILDTYGIERIIEILRFKYGAQIDSDLEKYITNMFNYNMKFIKDVLKKYLKVDEVDYVKRMCK